MNLRPLHDDVLVTPKDSNEISDSVIYIKDDRKDGTNWFSVLAVGDDVKEIKVGDIVLLKFGDHTVPVDVDGVRVAVSSEKDVLAVMGEG